MPVKYNVIIFHNNLVQFLLREAENEREWVRGIWNQWFDETFPLPESEKVVSLDQSGSEEEGVLEGNGDDLEKAISLHDIVMRQPLAEVGEHHREQPT